MYAPAASALHEARLLEDTHVLRDGLERHVERVRKLGDRLFLARDAAQDLPADRMGEGGEDVVEAVGSRVNH